MAEIFKQDDRVRLVCIKQCPSPLSERLLKVPIGSVGTVLAVDDGDMQFRMLVHVAFDDPYGPAICWADELEKLTVLDQIIEAL